MNDLAKGLLAPFVVFALLVALGWLAIDQATDSAAILNPEVSAPDVPASDPTADPFADDSSAPVEGQIQTYLDDIADGLFTWVIVVTAAGLACAILWFFISQRVQSRVVAPPGQSRAFPAWVGALIVYAAICAVSYFYFIEPLGIDATMDNSLFWAFIGLAAVLGLGAYWVATAIAASPVMKPSVPLAARRAR